MEARLRYLMRQVSFPVCVVTSSLPTNSPTSSSISTSSTSTSAFLRGATISSWNTVCLSPEPIISICLRLPSRLDAMLRKRYNDGVAAGEEQEKFHFALNVLSTGQEEVSRTFSIPTGLPATSSPTSNVSGQPSPISTLNNGNNNNNGNLYWHDERFASRKDFFIHPSHGNLPAFSNCIGILFCELIVPGTSNNNGNGNGIEPLLVGDHAVWLARVKAIEDGVGTSSSHARGDEPASSAVAPLLYWRTKYARPITLESASEALPQPKQVHATNNRTMPFPFLLQFHLLFEILFKHLQATRNQQQQQPDLSNEEEFQSLEALYHNQIVPEFQRLYQLNQHLFPEPAATTASGEQETSESGGNRFDNNASVSIDNTFRLVQRKTIGMFWSLYFAQEIKKILASTTTSSQVSTQTTALASLSIKTTAPSASPQQASLSFNQYFNDRMQGKLEKFNSILSAHYSQHTLESDVCIERWVAPDLKKLEYQIPPHVLHMTSVGK